MAIRTVGHGALDPVAFTGVLRGAEVELVVDVRRYPGSRRQPHVGAEAMAGWLGDAGIGHRWIEALGGRRRRHPRSPNVALTNDQFRAYADHMATDEFAAGIAELRDLAERRSVAIMCSESVWWRCHRRLIADHLVLVEGDEVDHLFHDGRTARHPPLAGARVVDRHLVYDVEP
jgi:uncharacterized protein (DUF488 family)